MPLVSLPLFGFALGAGLSWVSLGRLTASVRSLHAQALLVLVLLGTTAFAPAAALLAGAAPAWLLGYWIEPGSLGPWSLPLWTLANAASVPAGFAVASRFNTGARSAIRNWMVGLCLAVSILPLAVFAERTGVYASFAQFQGDFGVQSLVGGALGYLCMWCGLGVLGATWWARRCLKYLALGGTAGT